MSQAWLIALAVVTYYDYYDYVDLYGGGCGCNHLDGCRGESQVQRSDRSGSVARPADDHTQRPNRSNYCVPGGVGAENQASGQPRRIFCDISPSRIRAEDQAEQGFSPESRDLSFLI